MGDRSVVEETARVERASFEALYRRHSEQVYGFCLRRTHDGALADEARSTVFLEAWRRRHDVDLATRPAGPWLLAVARNVLRNQRRAAMRQHATIELLGSEAPVPFEDFSDSVHRRAVVAAVWRGVRSLPEPQRDVVALCLLGGHSYAAAAAALRVPVGTVRSRLSRARLQIALAVDREGPVVPTDHNDPEEK
jgi:RNA polymerase sigma-70 factor (ECF subfamily)